MNTTMKIQHQGVAPAFFNSLKQQPELAPLCTEAEADTPQEDDMLRRSQALVQTVTDRVFKEAQAWMKKFPADKTFDYLYLVKELVETQKANFVYRNLARNLQHEYSQEVEKFQKSKFGSAEEMYQFFADKKLITIEKDDDKISDRRTLNSLPSNRVHASYQNCRIAHFTELSQETKHLDLSYNNIPWKTLEMKYIYSSSLTSLDLSYNQLEFIPNLLPKTIKELRLRGNDMRAFDTFANLDKLTLLDISYMPNLSYITEGFWKNIGPNLIIVISPEMSKIFKVPSEAINKVTFVTCLDPTTPLKIDSSGKIICQSKPLERVLPSKKGISWRMFGFAAVIMGVLGFLIHKAWSRAKA